MICCNIRQMVEPKRRDGGQHPALVGNRLVHHDIERRQPIARDDEEIVVPRVVDVADLAAVQEREINIHAENLFASLGR